MLPEFGNPAPNYIVLGIGAVLSVCLVAGLVWSIAAGNVFPIFVFAIATLGLGALLWLKYSHWKRLAAGGRNRNLAWDIDLPDSQFLYLYTKS